MARRPRTDSGSASSSSMPGQVTSRRRATLRELQSSTVDGSALRPKEINAAPSLEKAEMYGINNERPTSSKIMALIGRIFIETIPQWLAIGVMLGLIFGGCCSNVSWSYEGQEIWTQELIEHLRSLRSKQLSSK
jgi:solute carrier family 35 (UDP-xylose/UDP-N-acetylglucosamine transporter), member B4